MREQSKYITRKGFQAEGTVKNKVLRPGVSLACSRIIKEAIVNEEESSWR